MRYRTLGEGENALRVSEACLGTMTWGEQNTEAEAHAQLDAAVSAGVNFIDTAELYPVPPVAATFGETERIIGRWLAADTSRRSSLVLATKVASFGRDYIPALRGVDLGGAPDPAQPARLTRAQVARALDSSLARLETTYVDLYQLHWPERYTNIFGARAYDRSAERDSTPIDEQVLAMKDALDSGKIRAWGLSNENGVGVAAFLEACERLGVPKPVSIQNDFSLLHRKFEEDGTAEACAPRFSKTENGVRLLVYGALAGGTLSGKYAKRSDGSRSAPADARHVKWPWFQARYASSRAFDAVDGYVDAAAAADTTPAQLALLWCRSKVYVGSVIIGATSLEQLRENLAAFELDPMDAAELAALDDDGLDYAAYYSGLGEVPLVADDGAASGEL